MNAPGPRPAPEINLDELERRLRAAGSQQGAWEDPLAELAKLVEPSKRLSAGSAGRRSVEAELAGGSQAGGALRPTLDEPDGDPEGGAPQDPVGAQFEVFPHSGPVAPPEARRGAGMKLAALALALAGVAMIGAVSALRGGVPGHHKQIPFVAAAQGPTKVQPPSGDNVGSTSDTGASLLKDNGKTAVKVVTSEEQPVDLIAEASTKAAAQPSPQLSPPPSSPAAADPDVVGGAPLQQTTNTPVVVATAAAPPVAPQFPDPKPVRTVSLRPDGTPIPTPVAVADATQVAASPSETPKPSARSVTKTANEAAANAQPSTPKIELPTRLSSKSSARIAVPKSETTAPADAANEPAAAGAPAKPEKPAKAAKTRLAAAEPAAPAAPAEPVDAAAASGGWAVQLAAPRSEAEAKSEIVRLNEKYAKELNGSTIGMQKAVVKGATIYRLRVVGLSKADAATLCARLKGNGGACFIAK
ncbi:MAG: SPOR domain-containing protein [Hyphomicrobiales bacterium]|nr:SPOR domain-containing protein [Hyphomicrobiales bacterium]